MTNQAPDNTKTLPEWVDLCPLEDVPSEGGRYVSVANQGLAVFRAGPDRVHVIDNTCPHAGGSLSGGFVRDGRVVCPWHGWPFDLRTGRCPDNTQIAVTTHPSRVVDGRVQIRGPG